MGWNKEGVPTEKRLKELNLTYVAEELKKMKRGLVKIKVKLKYFGLMVRATNKFSEKIEIEKGAAIIADVLEMLKEKYGNEFRKLVANSFVSYNGNLVRKYNTQIDDGGTICLLLPIGGG